MKRILPLLLMLSLFPACQPVADQSVDNTTTTALEKELAETKAELDRLKQDGKTKMSANTDAKIKTAHKEKSQPKEPPQRWKCTDPDDFECVETGPADTPKLCWQDYCPCDAPITSLDRTICRNARGGIEISDDQWAIGAQARDSKIEGDRLNAEMDDIISDMSRSQAER